jgi:hypothetical protein
MNARQKQAVQKKYKADADGKNREEFVQFLVDQASTELEAEEIANVLFAEPEETKSKSKAVKAETTGDHYQEWNCRVLTGEDGSKSAKKVELLREVVKITDVEADTLNHGRLHGGNSYAVMYFKAE